MLLWGDTKRVKYYLLDFYKYQRKEVSINKVFDLTHKENIKKAKGANTIIGDNLKLCVSKNISLIGHKDSTKSHLGKSCLINWGNFVELLIYRVRGEDKTFEDHLQNAPRNAKYTSQYIQNELIEYYQDSIVKQLGKSRETTGESQRNYILLNSGWWGHRLFYETTIGIKF